MAQKGSFRPAWYEGPLPSGSRRSLFKWGAAQEYKHPNGGLYKLLKETFGMRDEDFQEPADLALDKVPDEIPCTLSEKQVQSFEDLLGPVNVKKDTASRIRASYGKGMIDALRLRKGIIENLPDLVLAPRTKEDIVAILAYCLEQKIPLYVFGGGSTVTRGMEAVKGGVTLDMSIHMKRVVAFNELDQTICVEAGMQGPELEKVLQNAPQTLNAQRPYTCGHFPQSFEYSSVGGWVVTRGAGQNSTYYGKIEDMVISQEYVTPRGVIDTPCYPKNAIGPDLNQILIGNEGTFGILVNVTLKVHRWMPKNQRYFSYMFKDWPSALQAAREVMQCEGGFPSVFRLSDPEETEVAMRLYGVQDTPANGILNILGYKPEKRCLMLGMTDGENGFSANVRRKIGQIARRQGAFPLTGFVTKAWEHGRFRDPYLREDLGDHGILIDTLECAVKWSQLEQVHRDVRKFVKSRPETICMTHCSHFYPQGTNLYFIFIAQMKDIDAYLSLQYGILEAIQHSGAAMSHHHGLGKQTAPWLKEQIGETQMGILRTLKEYFDPDFVLNPGGTLGFDLSTEQAEKAWGINKKTDG